MWYARCDTFILHCCTARSHCLSCFYPRESLGSRDLSELLVRADLPDPPDPQDCLVLPERLVARYEVPVCRILTWNLNLFKRYRNVSL